MIKPTIGRMVWYYPGQNEQLVQENDAPLAAIIVAVRSNTNVNLTVFDAHGAPHGRTSVFLVQDGEPPDFVYSYAEWGLNQRQKTRKDD